MASINADHGKSPRNRKPTFCTLFLKSVIIHTQQVHTLLWFFFTINSINQSPRTPPSAVHLNLKVAITHGPLCSTTVTSATEWPPRRRRQDFNRSRGIGVRGLPAVYRVPKWFIWRLPQHSRPSTNCLRLPGLRPPLDGKEDAMVPNVIKSIGWGTRWIGHYRNRNCLAFYHCQMISE